MHASEFHLDRWKTSQRHLKWVAPYVKGVPYSLVAIVFGAVLFLGTVALHGGQPDRVDFNFHIKPILSDRCFSCHGPDDKARKAELRFDTKEGLFRSLEDGTRVVVPGKPEKSRLYQKITEADPAKRMPPPESNLHLSRTEKELIRRWIVEGAGWKRHWAFLPLEEVSIPEVQDTAWVKNPIDRFVMARLEAEGMQPSPRADREQLIRRLTFDLTGLPPTREEINAFLSDTAPGAYKRVVDRLLAAPAYGERMALDWMDVARYADTHGYQADRYRATWPWRDWVIQAFNDNLPYDDFITWQLAGDLLPDPSREQRMATAFNRLHMQTEEGGSVEEEFRVAYVRDRVDTFGTAFLGMTLQCAKCHDHKYDPISQREYYQLFRFFNNIDESGQTSFFTDSMPVPTMLLTDKKEERRLEELRAAVKNVEQEAEAIRAGAKKRFQNWRPVEIESLPLKGLLAAYDFETLEEGKTPASNKNEKPGESIDRVELAEGRGGNVLVLNGENGVQFGDVGSFSRVDPFTIGLWVRIPSKLQEGVILHRSKAPLDAGSRGYELYLEENRLRFGLTHMWPWHSISVRTTEPVPRDQWVHVTMCYDGSSQVEGIDLYLNGTPAMVTVLKDNLFKDILYERTEVHLTIGQRFRDHGFKGGQVDELRVFDRRLTPLEVAHMAGQSDLQTALRRTAESGAESLKNSERLFSYYLAHHDTGWNQHLESLHAARKAENDFVNGIPELMVMEEMEEPRPAHILIRGEYDQKGERVHAATPESILPFDSSRYERNRLGLAQWLTNPKNPLTARVTVNRYWQMHFGKGVVSTPGDFGNQGEWPSHPALLDWLAKRFIDSGWDLKGLHRLILTSATYQQDSKANKDLLRRDPENRLLARGPRLRLPAEMIRDNALAMSGLLVREIGGPSVKPYQPEGLWKEKSGAKYVPDEGEGLYRKSLYTFWKRTSPPPAMMTFDASERNNCIVERQRTSTPLQSLVLLNDIQLVEASRVLAERVLKEGGEDWKTRMRFLFRIMTTRAPSEEEMALLMKMVKGQLEEFESHPDRARALVAVGQTVADASLDEQSLAAVTAVANVLMSYDAVTMKR